MNKNVRKTETYLMCIPAKAIWQGVSPVEVSSGQKRNNFCMIGGNHAN